MLFTCLLSSTLILGACGGGGSSADATSFSGASASVDGSAAGVAAADAGSATGTTLAATSAGSGTSSSGSTGSASATGSSSSSAGSSDGTTKSSGSAPQTAVLPTVSGGYQITSAAAARLYGPGTWVMDDLWNINAQRTSGNDTFVSIRFRAPVSGNVKSVRLYWSDGSGYAGGNGGEIQLKILPDDGTTRHLPVWSATPLATGSRTPGALSMSNGTYGTPANRFAPDTLTPASSLQAGQLYHLVGINTSSDPVSNWSSWDMAWTLKANGLPGRWISPVDYAALSGTRPTGSSASPSWSDWTVDGHSSAYVMPIMQMTMQDGSSFGNSNMEGGNNDANGKLWQNGASNPIRERFTPSTTRTISGLSIQTAMVSGSGGLGWQVLQGSTVLASGTIAQSSANFKTDASVKSGVGVFSWYDVALPTRLTLAANTAYDVVFTPQDSSVWAFADQRNGGAYGFTYPAAFTESQAQWFNAGSWINANHWSHGSSATGSNWRVVLHQAN